MYTYCVKTSAPRSDSLSASNIGSAADDRRTTKKSKEVAFTPDKDMQAVNICTLFQGFVGSLVLSGYGFGSLIWIPVQTNFVNMYNVKEIVMHTHTHTHTHHCISIWGKNAFNIS